MTSVTDFMAFRGEPDGGLMRRNCIPIPSGLHVGRPSVTPSPDISPWSAIFLEPKQRDRASSHIVHGKVNRFCWKGVSTLSIKTVYSGELNLQCGPAAYRIEPGSFLVLNHGSEYSVNVDPTAPVEGLSIFFEEDMVEAALSAARRRFLDAGESAKANRIADLVFYERIHIDAGIMALLNAVYEQVRSENLNSAIVRKLHGLLLESLIDLQVEQWNEIQAVSAVRSVTKEELYRSLHRARDHAYASLGRNVTVDELAYVACLSTNYFLRSFRSLFGLTPHQYLIECRLNRARQLLTETTLGVSEICHLVGFQSLGSFSWLFKRRVGLSPERYRRQKLESEQILKKVDDSLANLAGLRHTLSG